MSRAELQKIVDACQHEFEKFGYTPKGFSFVCPKCTAYSFRKTADWTERKLPVNLVMSRAEGDCSICCLAMAHNCSYEKAVEISKGVKIHNTREMGAFLASLGYQAKSVKTYGEEVDSFSELCEPDDLLLVSGKVKATRQNHYFIYFNKQVYCSSHGVVAEERKLKEYEVFVPPIIIRKIKSYSSP